MVEGLLERGLADYKFDSMPTYLRFVVRKKDDLTGKRLGVFASAYALRDSGMLLEYEEEKITETLMWFQRNLRIPDKFTTSSRHNAKPKAISWFKDSAKGCISRMYDLNAILEQYGIFVEMIQTDSPGYVVYEDKHQITAEPFQSTGA